MSNTSTSNVATKQQIINLSWQIVALCQQIPDLPPTPATAAKVARNQLNNHQPTSNPQFTDANQIVDSNQAIGSNQTVVSNQVVDITTTELAHQITLLTLVCQELRQQSQETEKALRQIATDLQRLTRIMGISDSLQF
jgi:hypothetical protein